MSNDRFDSRPGGVRVGVIEESTLARAQATIHNAIISADITRAELARRMDRSRAFVTQMLRGSHNLTVKTLARALFACGGELEFSLIPLISGSRHPTPPPVCPTSVDGGPPVTSCPPSRNGGFPVDGG